jgi:diacylglycerol kinase (ATP)
MATTLPELPPPPSGQPAPEVPERKLVPPRNPGMLGAFLHAWNGLVYTVAYQRNMKSHVLAATLVGCVGSGVPLGLPEKVTLVFCVMQVFFAEVVNTALEALVDLHTEDFRELARVTKDTAAAGVLVLAIGTVVVFAAVLVNDWRVIATHPFEVVRQLEVGGPMAALGALLAWRRPGPRWLDLAPLLGALVLWAQTTTWTTSPVFSAMILSLIVLQAAAAYELRWKPASRRR